MKKNILLVEPDYRSKFPPLGLMKLSTYHKRRGDNVTFVRGRDQDLRSLHWHRIYISSLFTWELPRTVKTIKYYKDSVASPKYLFVGGIGATLLPDYIRENVECRIIHGQIEKRGMLGPNSPPVADFIPDYSLLDSVEYQYDPNDAYFAKITKGCIRKCKFCAVPLLEPKFGLLTPLDCQINEVNKHFGEKQNLVLMDNNVLAIKGIEEKINLIAELGFQKGAKLNQRQRHVDFNQGIDARLIARNPKIAELLGKLALKPVRLALDFISPEMERDYRRAVTLLTEQGFTSYTNYMLYNFKDTPEEFYRRLEINCELNKELGIRITGFPMRYIPPGHTQRGYIAPTWKWRWLRGIQCVLQATHGLVSPNPEFVQAAFGHDYNEFMEIISMPDRYIIYRDHYKDQGAKEWKGLFGKLPKSKKSDFVDILAWLNASHNKKDAINNINDYKLLIEHYYPNGKVPKYK